MTFAEDELRNLKFWCEWENPKGGKNAEVFGYELSLALDEAIESGTLGPRRSSDKVPFKETACAKLGVSHQILWKWERGKLVPKIEQLERLLTTLPRLYRELRRLQEVPNEEPVQGVEQTNRWKEKASDVLNNKLNDHAWAWVFRWPGVSFSQVHLDYDETVRYESPLMPKSAARVLDRWEKTNRRLASKLSDDKKEGWGTQVRLESVIQSSGHGEPEEYTVGLSPARFLHYKAIQADLWKRERERIELRNGYFENALDGISKPKDLRLPSVFAIHMAVVTRGRKVVLRQRFDEAPMFPGAWECSVGEMMHGPKYQGDFPHFDENGKPSWDRYLTNAMAEELGCDRATPYTFRLYGFAAEYFTLAPKLIVVCHCDADAAPLCAYAKSNPNDCAKDATDLDLTARDVAAAIHKYPSWGPTSKLALVLALLSMEKEEGSRQRVLDEVSRLLM